MSKPIALYCSNWFQAIKGTIIMQFPIFYGFVAPDIEASKPLGVLKTAFDLTAKLKAQLSIAIGALQLSMPSILVSKTVEDIVGSELRRCFDSAVAARARSDELARNSGLTIHTEILKGDFNRFRSQCISRARVHGPVIQGAYGRSRWSELILGGATRDMLCDNAWPVLMSY
jgi:hypothetical protein